MNVKKLKQSVEILKEDLDGALLGTDIWPTGNGQSIAGYNPNPQATALFERVTVYVKDSLTGSGFPSLNKFYMLDLDGGALVVVLQFEAGYQWGMLVDSTKVQMGLLLNIAIPNARKALLEALEE